MIPTRGQGFLGAAALALGSAVLGCGGDAPVSGTPVLLDGWAAIHREIVVPSCAFGSCHGGAQPAARLDLSQPASCGQLVGHMSCLFPGQPLVDPGAPEQSFLMAKLTGAGLTALPETSCGGATNRRMPFGAMELAPDKIAAVRAWIATGAACDGRAEPPPPDKGLTPGPTDGHKPPIDSVLPTVVVQTLVAPAEPTLAGDTALLIITLSAPAPDGGAPIVLAVSDATVLGAPATVVVASGETTATTSIIGKRPGSVTISATAAAGSAPATTTLRISGLLFTETLLQGTTAVDGAAWVKLANVSDAPIDLADYRLSAGRGLTDDAAIGLNGILLPGTCLVTGGPQSSADNGGPDFNLGLLWNFSDAVHASGDSEPHPLALALFDTLAPVAARPVDAVAFGAAPATLVGADGHPLPAWPLPPPGHSAIRTSADTWRDQPAPMPSRCDFSLVGP